MNDLRIDVDPISPSLRADISRRDAIRNFAGGGVAIALLAASAQFQQTVAHAQDATPAASPAGAIGVTSKPLGAGQPAAASGLELTLRRITIAPGGHIPPHTHPGALVILVEAGSFGYTALGGTILSSQIGTDGGTPAHTGLPVGIGVETVFGPGDWLFVDDPSDDVRNAGSDDVVLLVAGLTLIGEPFTTLMS